MLKKIVISIFSLTLFVSLHAAYKSEKEKNDEIYNNYESKQIIRISKESIEQEKVKFIQQENLNEKLKYAVIAGLWAAGSGVLIWLIFSEKETYGLEQDEIKKLKKLLLEEVRKKSKEKEAAAWYKKLYDDVKTGLFGMPKFLITSVITSLIFGKVFEVISKSLELKDKIFGLRNVCWFINYKTQFVKVIEDIVGLIENYRDSEDQITNEELLTIIPLLTPQINKILGFMDYRIEQLEKSSSNNSLLAKNVKEVIMNKVNSFYDSVELILNQKENKNSILDEFKNLSINIINKLNMFATIELQENFISDKSILQTLNKLHDSLIQSSLENQTYESLTAEELKNLGDMVNRFQHEVG